MALSAVPGDVSPFVALFRQALDTRGWSMRRLADEAGIPIASAHYVLTGQGRTVARTTWEPLAKALGLPFDVVERAELDSRTAHWELPPRAQKLSPAGRKALIAHLDLLLDLEARPVRRR